MQYAKPLVITNELHFVDCSNLCSKSPLQLGVHKLIEFSMLF